MIPAVGIPLGASERPLLKMVLPQGISLRYIEAGAGGEALILMHGGIGDCLSWEPQLAALAQRFRVVSYSRRFHFPNDNPGSDLSHSCRVDAQDLQEVLRLLRCGPVHLVGTSYGALAALTFAVDQPDQVRSLVLVEPPLPRWVAAEPAGAAVCDRFMNDVWQQASGWFDRGQAQLAMRALFDGMRGGAKFEFLDEIRRIGIMRNARAMQMLVRSKDPFPDLDRDEVAALPMPILLVSGKETVPIHRRAYRALANALPAACKAVITHAGHAPAAENPSEFNAVVLRFLMSCCE